MRGSTRGLCGILGTLVFLVAAGSANAHAQTIVPLGKPQPDSQNQIIANVQAAIGVLPPSPLCAVPPILGTGPWQVQFTASVDHNVIEQGVDKLTGYEFVVTAPTGAQPCYLAQVRAIGPGGATLSASLPFVLSIAAPAAPGVPGLSRSSGRVIKR